MLPLNGVSFSRHLEVASWLAFDLSCKMSPLTLTTGISSGADIDLSAMQSKLCGARNAVSFFFLKNTNLLFHKATGKLVGKG